MRRFFILLMLAFAVTACGTHINQPPDPGTPWPAAHNGTFASGSDSFVFNGDGKSVSWHFAQPAAGLGAEGKGTYVFQFGNEAWRYDAAEKLKLMPEGGKAVTFILGRPSTEDSIELLFEGEIRSFKK